MNCYDCANTGTYRDAVAICVDCGASVCIEHAVNTRHWLTRQVAIAGVQRIDPPTRLIRCATCHAAHAARGDVQQAENPRTARARTS